MQTIRLTLAIGKKKETEFIENNWVLNRINTKTEELRSKYKQKSGKYRWPEPLTRSDAGNSLKFGGRGWTATSYSLGNPTEPLTQPSVGTAAATTRNADLSVSLGHSPQTEVPEQEIMAKVSQLFFPARQKKITDIFGLHMGGPCFSQVYTRLHKHRKWIWMLGDKGKVCIYYRTTIWEPSS